MHLSGEGLPRDLDRAETHLRAAGKKGHRRAILALAEFYSRGDGRAPDLREAEIWYRRAAEHGDAQAQFIAGRLAATGDGAGQSLPDAARWFLKAAEQGHPVAAHNVATFYAQGQGVERDLDAARRWFQFAAEADIVAAQVQLARMNSRRRRRTARSRRRALLAGARDRAWRRRSQGAARLALSDRRAWRAQLRQGRVAAARSCGFRLSARRYATRPSLRRPLRPHAAPGRRAALVPDRSRSRPVRSAVLARASMLRQGIGAPADAAEAAQMVRPRRRTRPCRRRSSNWG